MKKLHSEWQDTPPEALPPRYFVRIEGTHGAYRELLEPPVLEKHVRLGLVRQIEGQRATARLHAPGDGWHYLPSRAEYHHNGSYWFASLATSEGPILANVADLCAELGISFEALYRAAYPNETGAVPTISAEDRAMRTRPPMLRDAKRVLADLEAVNYHSLRGALQDTLRDWHMPT